MIFECLYYDIIKKVPYDIAFETVFRSMLRKTPQKHKKRIETSQSREKFPIPTYKHTSNGFFIFQKFMHSRNFSLKSVKTKKLNYWGFFDGIFLLLIKGAFFQQNC